VTQPRFVCGYEILAELGRGSTGVFYKARHRAVKRDRLVALKVPSLDSTLQTPSAITCYQNEWNALRVLTYKPDPTIPRLYDVGCDSAWKNNYYVRELVEGSSFEQMVESGAVNLGNGIRVLSTVAAAVQRMHELGIAHRNLRASNVLVRTDGTPKLIGFGHVWPLVGLDRVSPGISGVSAEVDLLALQEMLAWLCGALRQHVPAPVEGVLQPGSVPSAGQFAEALDSYLQAT
jgi:serine/threonine protein kinase